MLKHRLYQDDLEYCISYSAIEWDKLANKTILITGATGTIGRFLIDAIMLRNKIYSSNIFIIAVSRTEKTARICFSDYFKNSQFRYVSHNINMPLTDIGNVDYIIHAASNTHPVAYATDPIGTITTNVFGTYHVLNYGKNHNVTRIMLLSTVEIYGENKSNSERFREQDCGYIDCATLRAGYPESKRVSESLCFAFQEKYVLDIVISRLCRVYGPTITNSDSKALSQFIHNGTNNEDIVLKSKGTQVFSYCYIADAVTALLVILLNGKSGEVYNIADPASEISLKGLAKLIADFSKKKVIFELPNQEEVKGFSKATKALLDSSKLAALNWLARDTIKSGIMKTIEILKNQGD